MTIQQMLKQFMRFLRNIQQDFKAQYPQMYRFMQTKEWQVVVIFIILLGTQLLRTFYIQVIQGNYYQ